MLGAGKEATERFIKVHKAGWQEILESPEMALMIIGRV